jgi:hypothetical protein
MVARHSLTFTATLLIGCLAGTAQAQRGPGGFGGPGGPGFGGPGGPGGFGHGMGKPLTGEPYTATVTNTSFEKLTNGTTITHSSTITEARDAQGRTYRLVTEPPRGSATQGFTRTTVVDPVAHTVTEWGSQSKTAIQFQLPTPRGDHGPWQGGPQGGGPGGPKPGEGGGRFHAEVTKTALPSQTIAGVSAEGFKTTMTIPAGAEGNDKPIVSTREVWTSTDLKIVLLEKSDDPRDGSHKTEVTALNPNSPDPTLFQIPAGYTVKTENGRRGH